jgi:hemolysin activation/secretion protein
MLFARSSNLSGLGDNLFVSILYSGKSNGQTASYSLPLGTYGTKFNLDATYFKMKLGKEYKVNEITGDTQILSPYFSWELALTEDFEANANLGMDIKSIKKKTDQEVSSNDQLRIPFFGFDLSKTDPAGRTDFSPRFNFGTSGFLGASHRNHDTSSRAGTGGSFFKYEHSLDRIQKMFQGSYISIHTQFLMGSHTLASSEQLQIGGADSVRGYPEGDYSADLGGYMNLDWTFPMYLIPKELTLIGQSVPLRYQIEPVIFVDLGGGKLKKTLSGEKEDKFLAGVGGGLRFNFKSFMLRLDWAKHVGDKPVSGSGPSTFYFTFQSEI